MRLTRTMWWLSGLTVLCGLVYLMATADTGPVDPTEVGGTQSHGTIVVNSAIIVFREGLEAVLIFAAVIASFLGANRSRRRPVVAGAAVAFAAGGGAWVVAQGLPAVGPPLGARVGGHTRGLAVRVLPVGTDLVRHQGH